MHNNLRIVSINAVSYGSTGNIMRGIAKAAESSIDAECYTFYGNWKNCPNDYKGGQRFGYRLENAICGTISRITGLYYIGHVFGTASLLSKIKRINPDIIHLHNLHLWVINVPMLFSYIKKHNIPVVWTFHDCWPITGHCTHFTIVKCDKWKTGCSHCPIYREYPTSYIDQSSTLWKWKKRWFSNVKQMSIVTPSRWLSELVKESFLKDYSVTTIHNGINLEIFRPYLNSFRERHKIDAQFVVLGVASNWSYRKGLDVFIELSKRLTSDYQIVLVGTDHIIDKFVPNNIISIHKTQNQQELAEIYSAADVFVNPTREENFPTVNMEALACGSPVITFNTGGSPEVIDDTCGSVIACNDIDAMEKEIIRITHEASFSEADCIKRAQAFNENSLYSEYVMLYEHLCSEKKD